MRTGLTLFNVLLVAISAGAIAGPRAGPSPPPNILLIISDDQGWGDYGFMGHPVIRTPALDRLASQSRLFPRGYVPSSLCSPSLASLLTGRYPHEHQITSNDPPLPAGKTAADAADDAAYRAARQELIGFVDQVPTLPRLLAVRGYVSFQAGKWWLGDYRRGGFTAGMTRGDPDRGGRHGDDGLRIGRETLQPVIDFMARAQQENKPFFVWYAPMMPHQPHNPPERLLAYYRGKTPSLEVARYWAMCEWLDETCGALLDELDCRALARKTLVVYLADNGWIQHPDADRYAPRSKQSPYEGGVRTPIMVRWTGHAAAARVETPVLSLDIAPTLLRAAGRKPPAALPGLNLLDAGALAARKAITGECFTHNAVDLRRPASSLRWRWVVEGDWKLILPAPQNEPDGKPELFDVATDPNEQVDLAAQQPERVRRLTALLDAWWSGPP